MLKYVLSSVFCRQGHLCTCFLSVEHYYYEAQNNPNYHQTVAAAVCHYQGYISLVPPPLCQLIPDSRPGDTMAPVVLPDDMMMDYMSTDDDNDKQVIIKEPRRDSTGSTGYSTCSSNMSSVSQHERSPRSPDSQDELRKNSHKEEEENDGDIENNNDDTPPAEEIKTKKLSPVEFVNQICANQRCLSAGFKGKKKEKGLETIRRGSTGYNTAIEVKTKNVTPESLGEAITSVINKLEDNIRDMKVNHDETIKQLQEEQDNKFLQFTMEQEQTLMKINNNMMEAERETVRIKSQHDQALETLKDNIMKVSKGSSDMMNEKENIFNEKQEELHNIALQHEEFIKDLTENLNKISTENRQSVSMLLENLEKAKKDNEEVLEKHNRALEELKELQEQSIADLKYELETARELSENFKNQTEAQNQDFQEENIELKAKLEYHDTAIRALENTLHVVTEKNHEMHQEMSQTHKKSLGDLRQEVFSQVMVVKEISRSVQEEFNDKLENISKILDDEKISNKEKIEEVREALDGIDMDIKMKMKETTDHLLTKIQDEVKTSGEAGRAGSDGIEVEISAVKNMLDSLSSRVSQMNEKMYDFEQNKRNNLIFYGVQTDPEETAESLAVNIQKLLKEKLMLKREMIITQVTCAQVLNFN